MKKLSLNNRGVCFLDLVVSICIYSLVLVCIFKLFTFNMKTYLKINQSYKDSLDLNYGFEYIINEINTCDEIYKLPESGGINTKYPNNIGFIIKDIDSENMELCRYIFYYLEDENLYRSAHLSNVINLPYNLNFNKNKNILAENIRNIHSEGKSGDVLEVQIESKKTEKSRSIDLAYKIIK